MFIKIYSLALCTLAIFDGVWLLLIAKGFYATRLSHLMATQVQYAPVIVFYLLYASAIAYFAVIPALDAHSWKLALGNGLFLGVVAYGAYDLTNNAILKSWPVSVTVVDLLWGTLLTGTVALITYKICA